MSKNSYSKRRQLSKSRNFNNNNNNKNKKNLNSILCTSPKMQKFS